MKTWSYHILATAKLIELRGPEQFNSEVALRLFNQLRRVIVWLPLPCTAPYIGLTYLVHGMRSKTGGLSLPNSEMVKVGTKHTV